MYACMCVYVCAYVIQRGREKREKRESKEYRFGGWRDKWMDGWMESRVRVEDEGLRIEGIRD